MDKCGVQCLEADLMDRRTLHEPLDMVDVVYNLASPPPGRPQEEYHKFNNEGLKNLLEEANEHGVKTFVHLSTLEVYGFGQKTAIEEGAPVSPTNQYQRAKLESERIICDFAKTSGSEMKVRVVRAARAIGSRDGTLATPLLKMIEGGKVVLPSGSFAKVSFSHPKDIAQALLRSASSNGKGAETLLVKSFDASIEEVSGALIRASGKPAVVKRSGVFSGKTLLPAYTVEQLRAGLTLSDNLQQSWKKVNYVPVYGPEEVAADIAEWYRKEPWTTEDLA
jgi:nucleoside-diphosphate-sugar epimerase